MHEPIRIEDFGNIQMVYHIQYDAVKHQGYFMVKKPDLMTNTYLISLHQVDLKSERVENLNVDHNPYYYILADSKLLLAYEEQSGSRIVLFDPESKEYTKQCSVPNTIIKGYYCDGRLIFKASLKREQMDKARFYKQVGIQESHCLYSVCLKTGEMNQVSDTEVDVDQVTFNEAKKCLVYTGFKLDRIKPLYSDVYTYQLASGETQRWTQSKYRINQIGCHDEKVLFTGIELDTHSRNDNQDTYIICLKDGNIKPLTLFRDKSLESLGVMGDSHAKSGSRFRKTADKAYYVSIDRFGETLRSISVDGYEKVYGTGLRTIDTFAVCEEGVLLAGVSSDQLHEVYWIHKGEIKQLTALNQWLSEKAYQKPMYHNEPVDGWVIPPQNQSEGKNYPGVLMIHGGPKAIYADVYSHDMQLLSQAGYYVFYCNPRGSDGRGDAFANIRGHYGEWAFEDLMAWTDNVLKAYPNLDATRLGVMGGSYGGYMTNYIITHTDRFKAAVSARGISSMMTGFLSSDIGYEYVFEYMGNNEHPWSGHRQYDKASPLNYAHKVRTPTLFLHGKEDVRCPYSESTQMYSALVYLGVETDIHLFDHEGHSYEVVGKPQSKLKRYELFLEWFNKYL